MTPPFSVQDLCEKIFDLEAEYNLLDFEIGGVKVWQYLRMPIYYEIAKKTGALDEPHPHRLNLRARLTERLSLLTSSLFHNPFIATQPVDVLLVDHERSMRFHNEWVDIYTHFFLKELNAQGRTCLVLEKPYAGRHLRQPTPQRKHFDFIFLDQWLRRRFFRYQVTSVEHNRVIEINQAISDVFGIKIDLPAQFADTVFRFRTNYRLCRRLLERLRPKTVYVVVSYFHLGALIRAGKDLGIEVVEFQHGVFSRYHLGYSFPGRTAPLDYFPDKFLTWGNFWSELIDWPIPRQNVIPAGFPYFHHMRQSHVDIPRRPGRILVLSQGAIGRQLAERVTSCIGELDNFEVIYKLHPSEYACWREYPLLAALAQRKNVTIIDYNADLYRLFAEAEYQFGVFSTAVYEGIGMGCKTVLFDLPGSEYMENLLERGLAVLQRQGGSMTECIRAADAIDTRHSRVELFDDVRIEN